MLAKAQEWNHMNQKPERKKYAYIIVGGIHFSYSFQTMKIDQSCTLGEKLSLNVGLISSIIPNKFTIKMNKYGSMIVGKIHSADII